LRDHDNTKILLYKLSVQYLVVKPVCVFPVIVYFRFWYFCFITSYSTRF